MTQRRFSWFSQKAEPPARWDLRHIGWGLACVAACRKGMAKVPCLVDWRAGCRPPDVDSIAQPATTMAVGVDDGRARARLLARGFGDAVGTQVALVELAARLMKLEILAGALPRRRVAGPVTLDLFLRDGQAGGVWLGLHPREFALLWRLAETPDRPVSRRELLADVWRLDHIPETNSLEVHVSRLRAELAISRCAWLVETHPRGGYCLGKSEETARSVFAFGTCEALDRQVSIGNGNDQDNTSKETEHAGERSGID
ncbi:winged helix-turn-helix domain-containing protein [Qipengyuania zhejiangensis]|uniref:winged helix-turn-helix domain-containing protein n=1 Tax=Qipengyuania zhejiangensis TaxID=3077782 RepID=UPI002D79CFF8|nr:winged helix-turn-helix domain-containing protein [Qipengyuania sp. Z2]